ncbi:MAG TPA: hypothetical protein VMH50_08730 [Thermoleophilia bacterium]|nr:hypothetical protein [Thermoleophilia bacterium]
MDATLAKKLQLRPGQALRVLYAPEGLGPGLTASDEAAGEDAAGMPAARPGAVPAPGTLVFVTTFTEAEERCGPAVEAAAADELSWVAYPKAGRLGTDLNRDSLAALMTGRGVRPVRQVALDDTWSALRFRPPAP